MDNSKTIDHRLKLGWKFVVVEALIFSLITISFNFTNITFGKAITVLFFGLGVGYLSKILFEKMVTFHPGKAGTKLLGRIRIKLYDDEVMVKEGLANHFKGWEGVGGKLVLTNKRLVFKSHNFNIQRHEQAIPLEQIQSLSEGMSLKKYKNVLWVELTNNEKHKFIVDVDTTPQWIAEIEKLKASPSA